MKKDTPLQETGTHWLTRLPQHLHLIQDETLYSDIQASVVTFLFILCGNVKQAHTRRRKGYI